VAPPYRPNVPIGVFGNLGLSSSLPLFPFFHSLTTFLFRSSPSSAVAMMGVAAADLVVGAALGPAPVSEPRNPKGVPEDIMDYEVEPEVASEAALEVVQEAPPPSHGARAPLLLAPRRATASGAATGKGMEVVLGHPTPNSPGDISMSEAMSTAHQALSQAHHILHREGEELADEHHRLQLWTSMLKRTTMSEKAAARARQHGFDL
jgi:hypothetical protein